MSVSIDEIDSMAEIVEEKDVKKRFLCTHTQKYVPYKEVIF